MKKEMKMVTDYTLKSIMMSEQDFTDLAEQLLCMLIASSNGQGIAISENIYSMLPEKQKGLFEQRVNLLTNYQPNKNIK